jgi:rare lipoprotein A
MMRRLIIVVCLVAIIFGMVHEKCYPAEVITASFYNIESCQKEGTWQKYGGRCANGEKFDDKKLCAASWDYAFGTKLKVFNLKNNKWVIVEVVDRGPSRKLYKQGRKLDLSEEAFSRIALCEQGVIPVRIEVMKWTQD